MSQNSQSGFSGSADAVVIGAGLAGLYAAYRLQELDLDFRVIEAGHEVGGTWYWNRYPGARCDIPSLEYSYSFSEELQQEWEWSERYATQAEILRYINHVADRFDLRRHIRFGTRVTAAAFDETSGRWRVSLDDGSSLETKYLISAAGVLSASNIPDIPDMDAFEGEIHRTSAWPHRQIELAGRRIGVVGTGSSGMQFITSAAPLAAQLTVFQRTANFVVPVRNQPFSADDLAAYKRNYRQYREQARNDRSGIVLERGTKSVFDATPAERKAAYDACWELGKFSCLAASFTDLGTDLAANETVADYVRNRIAEVVKDPQTREDLTPRGYPFGTKRVCMVSGYFETFNRPNVKLVNLKREPIERMTPRGIATTAQEYDLDMIVFATGFDAFTGPLTRMDISGRGGRTLAEAWADGTRTYLGLQTAGFPNLFMITGPGSPSIVSNTILSIEQHVDWIARCIEHLEENGIATIEASEAAEQQWVRHVGALADATLHPKGPSYMVGANVAGKPRVYMPYLGGVPRYRTECDEVEANGYRGFELRASAGQAQA